MKINKKLITVCAVALFTTACAAGDKKQNGPKSDRKGPPAEAFTACKNLSVGASCTVSTPRGTIEGSCAAAPNGESDTLACAPAGGKGKGPRPQ